jgi:hypothetical protein
MTIPLTDPFSDAADDKDVPPQRLALVFSTADVEMLGWRLGTLADKLQENNLAAVRILPKRYSELERNQPYVAFISITPNLGGEQCCFTCSDDKG